jgi:hypothetical protein
MRDLFFKTTQARHPSALLRFVYTFLRLRNQSVFFVRPRSRFSLFFRLQILRKLFVWFYTDKFARRSVFNRLIRVRSSTFRTFLNFCTTLETYVPVLLYRFHFVDNMRHSFVAIKSGFIFRNGRRVRRFDTNIRLGDFLECFFDDHLRILGFLHLIKCLPTLRFRLTLQDSIVNIGAFFSLFIKNYTFFSLSEKTLLTELDVSTAVTQSQYFNSQFLEQAFVSFLFSRVFLTLFRFDPVSRFRLVRRLVGASMVPVRLRQWKTKTIGFWWSTPVVLGLGSHLQEPLFSGLDEVKLSVGALFGKLVVVERDMANAPDFVINSIRSRYLFTEDGLVTR